MLGFVAGPDTPRLGKSSPGLLREFFRAVMALLAAAACALALGLVGCGRAVDGMLP